MTAPSKRKCIVCNKSLTGRADKKFCDIGCRNDFNNQLNSVSNNHIRNINNALRKNRRILESCLSGNAGKSIVLKEDLLQNGFFMQYFTQQVITPQGNTCFLCYEYGYIPKDEYHIEVVKKENLSKSNSL